MAPPFDGGDYADWTWQQIQAAILAGRPQTFEDAGKDFGDAKTKLDDVAAAGKKGTDDLTGPGGTWTGPASVAFTGLMNKLLTIVVGHADVLGGPPSYQSVLDDAGESLTDAQTAVKEAMTQAAQDTIDRYDDDVAAYNEAAKAYNEGNGPAPGEIGPPPYVANGGDAGPTVDVSRYPDIEAALNEKMRGIITTLAAAYSAAGGRLTAPDDAPPPSPADLPAPALKTDVGGAGIPPPGGPAAAEPPGTIGPRAPGVGDLSLVTEPGALDTAVRDPATVPLLVPLDPAVAAPPPIVAGLQNRPGAGFDGVLGARPFAGLGTGVPTPLDGARPGILGAPTVPPVSSVPPIGLSITAPAPPGGRTTGPPAVPVPGSPRTPGAMPPVMPPGGGYGLLSAGPDGKGRPMPANVFGDAPDGVGRPMPSMGAPYADEEDERQRRNEYADRDDDAWGSAPGTPTLGR